MSGDSSPPPGDLAEKIARLVKERGWNQEDFARISNLNRHTVRQIMQSDGTRNLRNATVGSCAKALGLSVHELTHWPLDRLLLRMNNPRALDNEGNAARLFEQATQPELMSWLERNPERARQLSPAEIDELLSLQGTGGPLTSFGVDHYVGLIERKRKLLEQVHAIANTELIDLLEKLVTLMYEKVQPYGDRR
ncbi:MAG: helix-turn-helix domain-containing protein [Gemmataceae bacterium]|nr:helix-turn-helix domain-containing protein [Gemmataceae bacterium]